MGLGKEEIRGGKIMLAVVVVSIVVSVVVVVALGRRNCGRILWYKGVGGSWAGRRRRNARGSLRREAVLFSWNQLISSSRSSSDTRLDDRRFRVLLKGNAALKLSILASENELSSLMSYSEEVTEERPDCS